jgi:hypothetical protein
MIRLDMPADLLAASDSYTPAVRRALLVIVAVSMPDTDQVDLAATSPVGRGRSKHAQN